MKKIALSTLQKEKRKDVIEACEKAGVPYKMFKFEGHCRGYVDGVSYSEETYRTHNNGTGEFFYCSSKEPGQTIEHDDNEWTVVWNKYIRGDAYYFSVHSLIIVPSKYIKQEA